MTDTFQENLAKSLRAYQTGGPLLWRVDLTLSKEDFKSPAETARLEAVRCAGLHAAATKELKKLRRDVAARGTETATDKADIKALKAARRTYRQNGKQAWAEYLGHMEGKTIPQS